MISLPHGIGRISVMISAPKQARLSGSLLSHRILGIAIEARIGRLMDDADDPLAFHTGKIRPHQVVMRKINNIAAGERARWQRENQTGTTQDRQSHSTRNSSAVIGQCRLICKLIFYPAGFVPLCQQ
jgi:hypothetical protein